MSTSTDGSESPAAPVRYRCTACGNLTRFDVRTTRTTRAFHHFTVGGDLQVEDIEVLAETIEEVSCRWCNSATGVVEVTGDLTAAEPSGGADPAAGAGPPS